MTRINPDYASSPYSMNVASSRKPSEKTAGYSIRFNGANVIVQEKGEKDFRADLLRTYAEYMAKTQVISVSDKKNDKDDSADDALRKQLADEKERAGVASG